MAGVRDPAFWRRFSMAVHLDEEQGNGIEKRSPSEASSGHGIKHTDSWLERTRRKQRRTMMCGWFIVFGFLVVIAAVVMVILWFLKVGPWAEVAS